MKSSIFFGLLLAMLLSVNGQTQKALYKVGRPSPPAIIYKTKADYNQYVAITLSDDKTKIISYPAPQDVFYQGKLAMPSTLPHGYLLDNRGVTPNSVFIKITYAEYAKMKEAPSQDELYKLIIDKSPFSEMYDLGARSNYKNEQKDIAAIVKKHKLKEYKKLI